MAVIGVHQIGKPLTQSARRQGQRVGRYLHVFEQDLRLGDAAQPHRRLPRADPQALGLVADRDKATDPFLFTVLVEDAGEDEVEP